MNAKNNKSKQEDAASSGGIKRSWEYRSGKFALRIVAVLFFISYLIASAPLSWMWATSTYYKSQPLSKLDDMVKAYAGKDDQSKLMLWVQARPKEERAQIKEKLLPYAGQLDSVLFLFFAEWAVQNFEAREIVFWNYYARYRLRYDALRCGAPNSVINMDGFVSLISEEFIDSIVERNPHLLPETIQRVLDMDALYPASNSPVGICKIIYKIERLEFNPVRRENWPALRHTLRAVTEYSLSQMRPQNSGLDTTPQNPPLEIAPDKDGE